MTVEQRDKYAYELMVKNNPDEAVKQLLLKDKLSEENERLSKNQRYYKDGVFSLEYDKETMSDMIDDYKSRINKAIEYIESYNLPKDLGGLSECPISVGDLKKLLNILKGEE